MKARWNRFSWTNAPHVLAVGPRCMKPGYGFYLIPGRCPIFIRPDGKVLLHYVEDVFPYLIEPQGSGFQDFENFRIDTMLIPECALLADNLAVQAS